MTKCASNRKSYDGKAEGLESGWLTFEADGEVAATPDNGTRYRPEGKHCRIKEKGPAVAGPYELVAGLGFEPRTFRL